ncbi:hypothetical protein CDL15_Pgr021207 [Punica granatum]|uniref:Uncharacterized protein n=1 Tax=Punica granatum TaxID=22663 RepID=A0A218WVU1_PUNGR|nr:hypothetical protein CDL15_Pgr021207 [Punica granatum]
MPKKPVRTRKICEGRKEGNSGGARLNSSRHAATSSRRKVRVVRNPEKVMARLAMVVGRNGNKEAREAVKPSREPDSG